MNKLEEKALKHFLVKNRQKIKEMIPTAREVELLDFIKRKRIAGSDDIRDRFNLSVQNANASLVRLWRKGYLDRRDIGHATGGSYYEYYLNF